MEKEFRIALALRCPTIPACPIFFRGAHAFAHTKPDWEIIWQNGTTMLTWEEALATRPDGILTVLMDQKITEKDACGAHVVVLNSVPDSFPFHKVRPHNRAAGAKGGVHLLERKLEHFAFVGFEDTFFSEWRLAGFQDALRAAG